MRKSILVIYFKKEQIYLCKEHNSSFWVNTPNQYPTITIVYCRSKHLFHLHHYYHIKYHSIHYIQLNLNPKWISILLNRIQSNRWHQPKEFDGIFPPAVSLWFLFFHPLPTKFNCCPTLIRTSRWAVQLQIMKVVTQLLDNHDQKSVSSTTEPNRISSNILTTLPVTQNDKKNTTST